MIRQPIVSLLGHVDHGKTSLLDSIRGSAVAAREAGGITQAIGASIIPLDSIKKVCGPLLSALKGNLNLPGLLFIDTPGHAAFVNLRKRGGNLADIVILVVDLNEGLKPQTIESLQILKQYKTPFLIAANKVDVVTGFPTVKASLLNKLNSMPPHAQQEFDTKFYTLVGQLSEQGFNCDRFDRVSDYTQQVAMVPVSARTRDGIPELLMVLVGLTQRYLGERLVVDHTGNAKGTVLEVKEEQGLGATLDVILYDGTLHVNDTLVIGGMQGAVVSKVKSLLEPAPLKEMREKKTQFKQLKEVLAATGVKIAGPGLRDVVAGMPLIGLAPSSSHDELQSANERVQHEVEDVLVPTEKHGVVIKADSIGSLEALTFLLKQENIPVVRASVGPITKKDISDAEAERESHPLNGVILCFNVSGTLPHETSIHVIAHPVVYQIIDDYLVWKESQKKTIEKGQLGTLPSPARIELLRGYVFRQSNPAVVGVEIQEGSLKTGSRLMLKTGNVVSTVKGIQREQENVTEAKRGEKVAVSLTDVIVGRHIKEGDMLYTFVTEEEFRKFKDLREHLSADMKLVLKEIASIMREHNPVWGV